MTIPDITIDELNSYFHRVIESFKTNPITYTDDTVDGIPWILMERIQSILEEQQSDKDVIMMSMVMGSMFINMFTDEQIPHIVRTCCIIKKE